MPSSATLGDLGLVGPGPLGPQLEHARAFVRAMPVGVHFLDLGSGGGLPGLVIVADRPDVSGVLLDATQRRCEFLRDACDRLEVSERTEVVCARAEDAARQPELRAAFDVVTARSFGPPPVTAECAIGFVRPGGEILVSEPPEPDPDRWPSDGLAGLGLLAEAVQEAARRTSFGCGSSSPWTRGGPNVLGSPASAPLVAADAGRQAAHPCVALGSGGSFHVKR